MKLSRFRNLLLLFTTVAVSFCVLELVARKWLHVSEKWPNNSYWMQQKWLDNHSILNPSTTTYPIDEYDSLLGWKTKSNLRHIELAQHWHVSTNSEGVRGTTEYRKEKSTKLRILAIGDSFTFGECVNDSQTFPAVLEKLLDSAEVINLAIHGYGHDQQLLQLMHQGLQYQPDIVLLGFLNDDVARNELHFRDFAKPWFILEGADISLKGVPVPSSHFFLNQFQLKSWALFRCAIIEQFDNSNNGFVESKVSKKILEEMISVTEQTGAKFMSVYLPWQSECEQNKSGHHPLFDSLGSKPNVTLIDPTKAIHHFLQNEKDKNKHFSCHYSPEVYALIAKQVAVTIQKGNNN